MFKNEIRKMLQNKLVVAGLIIALFIPTLYSGTFLWAFWNPYDHTDELKVAVVNQDVTVSAQGKELNLGEEIIRELKENKDFDWNFVNEETALKGMEENKYSMMLKIPADFSERATTAFSDEPKKPVIDYVPNQAKNYMISMLQNSMVSDVEANISGKITEIYLEQLAKNVADAQEGMEQVGVHVNELSNGLDELQPSLDQVIMSTTGIPLEKKEQLTSALSAVADGAKQLDNTLQVNQAESAAIQFKKENIAMAASPLVVKASPYTEVENYGNGFAPFTLSLGLFIGAMVITIVFPTVMPFTRPTSILGWFNSKFVIVAIAAILQALIADLVLIYGLGIEVAYIGYFILFSIIVSLAIAATLQFLTTIFKDGSRLVMVVMIIIQITGSGGTFPTEMVPAFLQKASILMPMTYSIQGFRALISNENHSFMWANLGAMSIFFIVAVIGTILYIAFAYMKIKKKPEIYEQQALKGSI